MSSDEPSERPSDPPAVGRRAFVRTAATAGVGLWAAPALARASAARRGNGPANERVRVAVMGVNSRGYEVSQIFAATPNTEVVYVCDVDSRAVAKATAAIEKKQAGRPRGVADFRRALDDHAVDALYIAAPDHWHAPAAILALKAGKHVYVEKPCGHNPREGELLVEAQRRHGRLVQMGSQQRSAPESIELVGEIRRGLIGRPYLARTWYANTRGSIGHGNAAPVPAWLDYELWQGPAPRTAYRDNVIHYNWHWFHRWGTGEICNNGTHEIDVARWALGVDYPVRVASTGGRYQFRDDWEFPDAQQVTYEFGDGSVITWEGRSCNGFETEGRGRGTAVYGTAGTAVVDRNGYTVYDLKGKQVVKQALAKQTTDALDVRGGDTLTVRHVANFIDAVRTGAPLNAPIAEGHKSTLLAHLGNLAQQAGRALRTNPADGRILGDAEAMRGWTREYAPGWEPTVA